VCPPEYRSQVINGASIKPPDEDLLLRSAGKTGHAFGVATGALVWLVFLSLAQGRL